MQIHERSPSERLFHALLFEVLAILICAPVAAWITGESLFDMGVLTAVIATIAVLWNILYNWLFDRMQARWRFERSYRIRVAHSFGFEFGLIIIAIPFVAWWLDVSIWHALVLDIGFVLFYLPYGFFFNLGYDKIRQNLLRAR